MIQTIMAAWDREAMRQVTGCVAEKLGRVGFLVGPWGRVLLGSHP